RTQKRRRNLGSCDAPGRTDLQNQSGSYPVRDRSRKTTARVAVCLSLAFSGVVALGAYSNPVEAAIAKSLLDNHNIFCRLADENVNLLGGGPLAMPIRLLVAEDQAEEAARILETKSPELSE